MQISNPSVQLHCSEISSDSASRKFLLHNKNIPFVLMGKAWIFLLVRGPLIWQQALQHTSLKQIVYPKRKTLSLFTHPHTMPNQYDILSGHSFNPIIIKGGLGLKKKEKKLHTIFKKKKVFQTIRF